MGSVQHIWNSISDPVGDNQPVVVHEDTIAWVKLVSVLVVFLALGRRRRRAR